MNLNMSVRHGAFILKQSDPKFQAEILISSTRWTRHVLRRLESFKIRALIKIESGGKLLSVCRYKLHEHWTLEKQHLQAWQQFHLDHYALQIDHAHVARSHIYIVNPLSRTAVKGERKENYFYGRPSLLSL